MNHRLAKYYQRGDVSPSTPAIHIVMNERDISQYGGGFTSYVVGFHFADFSAPVLKLADKRMKPTEPVKALESAKSEDGIPWRMIQMPCGHVVSRFAHRCPIDHHPNTWVKKQRLLGAAVVILGVIGLLFGTGEAWKLSLIVIGCGIAWRIFLSAAESWYGKPRE